MSARTYKLISGGHSRWVGPKAGGHREEFVVGDFLGDLSPEEVRSFGDRIQRVFPEEKTLRKYAAQLAKNVAGVGEFINTLGAEELRVILSEEEAASAPRKGVLAAINEKLSKIQEAGA